jgi:mono/diheme cytochrome c family protein
MKLKFLAQLSISNLMKNNNYFYLLFFLFVNLFFLPAKSDPIFEMGKTIFLEQGNCAACHTLADAKSNGEIGPNLNQIKPDIARVISTVTNGIGVMPPYKDLLSKEEIEAVAHYVSITAAE